MRLVFYQPLTARIGHHLKELVRLKSHSAYRKYHYFIPHLFHHKSRDVAIFCDAVGSSKLSKIYSYLKCLAWMVINGIKPWKVAILTHLEQLNPKVDILFVYPFLSLDYRLLDKSDSIVCSYQGVKVFHFSHYFDQTEKVCSFVNKQKYGYIVADGSIDKNVLYRRFVKQVPFYLLPFALRERYVSKTPFLARKAKCLASGTKSKIIPHCHKEFYREFQSPYLHRLRGEIYDKREEIKPFIDALIFDFYELSEIKPKNFWHQLILKKRKIIGNDRKKFFSFDIIQKYNEYQMFVSPEEESGSPSISFIEGMACGCAYIARPEYYLDYGMVPSVHFIPYDGTLVGLTKVIQFYQERPEEAEQIANNGRQFVLTHFSPKLIADNFWKYLESIVYADKN